MTTKKRSPLRAIVIVAAVLVAGYFINVEVQTRLGERALAASGLQIRSLDEAKSEAAASNKLVLANLSAIWCPACRAMDKSVFSDPAVQQDIAAKYVYARVEYESDEGKAFRERYSTQGFPVLLALRPDGELVRQLPVETDSEAFRSHL